MPVVGTSILLHGRIDGQMDTSEQTTLETIKQTKRRRYVREVQAALHSQSGNPAVCEERLLFT